MTRAGLLILLTGLLGIPVGVGAFTFVYAKGFSYLSPDPRACVNCHVMNPAVRRLAQERPPAHRDLRRVPSAARGHREVGGQGRARLPPLRRLHAAELQGADRDHAARPRHGPRQLRALSRGARPGDRRRPGRAARRARLSALPRQRRTRRRRLRDGRAIMAGVGSPSVRLRGWLLAVLGLVGIAGVTVLLLALLTNIFERKQEARQTFVRLVEVTEDTTDPKVWGQNWPQQYDSYLRTSLPTTTKYGGRGLGASDTGPAEQKLDRDPWLKRIFAGYAFALDYRDRRGHFYALFDQEQTRRVTEKQQPGACLQCHASNLAALPLRRKGRRAEGLRAGVGHAVPRGARDEGRQGAAPRPALRRVRRLPRSQDHGRPRHPAGLHRRHQGAQGQAGHRRLRPEPRRHPPGDALVRVRPVPRRVLLQGAGQGRDLSRGRTGSRSRRSRPTTTRKASPTGCTPRPAPRC